MSRCGSTTKATVPSWTTYVRSPREAVSRVRTVRSFIGTMLPRADPRGYLPNHRTERIAHGRHHADRRQLRAHGHGERARARRLLGGVVRSVPPVRPHLRGRLR